MSSPNTPIKRRIFAVLVGTERVQVRVTKTQRKSKPDDVEAPFGLRQFVRLPAGYTLTMSNYSYSEKIRDSWLIDYKRDQAERYVAAAINLFG